MTIRPLKTILFAAAFCSMTILGWAQPRPIVLEIDLDNLVAYVDNANFPSAVRLADITAVNGHPAQGTYLGVPFLVELASGSKAGDPPPNREKGSFRQESFEIRGLNGALVGSIMTIGPAGGTPPPGAPSAQQNGDLAVVGGTGAYLGIRGEKGRGAAIARLRYAAKDEDPANRRQIGGGHIREILYVIPMSPPEIVVSGDCPAITHWADSTPVSVTNPAVAGEVLSLLATGLGPTHPSPEVGRPFPNSPVMPVNSPLQVTVNGKIAEVISAAGSPGTIDHYQVNFRLPPGTEKGTATIQVTSAWISSTPATFDVK